MDQFQLSFAGKQINGGGILEGRNKKRVLFFQRESEKHVCTIYICMETWQNGTKALCIIIHKIMKKLNNFKK